MLHILIWLDMLPRVREFQDNFTMLSCNLNAKLQRVYSTLFIVLMFIIISHLCPYYLFTILCDYNVRDMKQLIKMCMQRRKKAYIYRLSVARKTDITATASGGHCMWMIPSRLYHRPINTIYKPFITFPQLRVLAFARTVCVFSPAVLGN